MILAGAVLALSVAAVVWVARPRLEAWIAAQVAAALRAAVPPPSTVTGLRVTLLPPSLEVEAIAAGDPGAPALDLRSASLRFDPRTWSLEANVEQIAVDAAQWAASGAGSADFDPALLEWLPSVVLRVAALDVTAGASAASARDLRLEVAPRLLAAEATVEASGLRVTRGGESLDFRSPRVEATVGSAGIALRSGLLQGDAVAIAVEPAGGATAVEIGADLLRLGRFLELPRPLGGELRWKGSADFGAGVREVADLTLAGDLEVVGLSAADWHLERLAARVSFDGRRLALESIDAGSGDLAASGAAELEVDESWPFRADLTLQPSSASALFAAAGDAFASAPAAVGLEVVGRAVPLFFESTLSADLPALHRIVPEREGRAAKTVDAALRVEIRHEEGRTAATASLSLSPAGTAAAGAPVVAADLRIAAGGAVEGDIVLAIADVRALEPLAPQLGAGAIRGAIRLAGTIADPTAEGSLVADGIVLSGTRFERLGGGFAVDRNAVEARALEVRALGGALRLEGRLALAAEADNDWRVILDHLDLSSVWIVLDAAGIGLPYLSGEVDGEARARGTWENVDLHARVESGAVEIGAERLSGVALRVAAQSRRWRIDGEVGRRADESITFAGAGTGLGDMWLSLWSTGWRVSDFSSLGELPEPRGEVYLRADLYGRLEAPLGGIQLSVLDLRLGERDIGTITAEAHAMPSGSVELYLGDERESLALQGELRPGERRPFRLQASLRDFDLAHILAPDQAVTLPAHGRGEVRGDLVDLRRSLDGEIELTRFAVGRDALRMAAVAPIVLQARQGRVEVQSCRLEGDFGSLVVRGGAGLGGAVDLHVGIDADARVLEAIPGSPVRWANGRVSLDAAVQRPAGGTLDLGGSGAVNDFSVDLGLPFLLTRADGTFHLQDSRVLLDDVRGRAGGGSFELEGYVDVVDGPRLEWSATEVNSGFLDWLEDQVSGRGEIRGSWDEVEVVGDIRVVSAVYDRNLELTDLLPVFRRQLGPAPPKPGEKAIGLDLDVRALDSIFVDNNIARAEFAADLHIGGTDLDVLLDGDIELLDGEATILDRRFLLTKGRVRFDGRPKINPELEFVADTDVSTPDAEYHVVAEVAGTLDDPRVRLSADDSSLDTNDLVMLLTVGKTAAQLQREGMSVTDIATLAPMLYGQQLERGVQQYLPIDRFSLEPGFSRTTGDFEPKITVGTEIAPRLRGTLTTTVAAATQNKVQLEYQLTPRVVALASWESRTQTNAGGFGGGFKLRYTFRYFPPYSLLPPGWLNWEEP